MARGLFITGFTISEVLAIQQRAKEFLLEGKQFTLPVDQVLEECGHALRVLDPETYGKPRMAAASFISGHLAK